MEDGDFPQQVSSYLSQLQITREVKKILTRKMKINMNTKIIFAPGEQFYPCLVNCPVAYSESQVIES